MNGNVLLLLATQLAVGSPPTDPPRVRVEFRVDTATVLWNDYVAQERPRFTAIVARALRDGLEQDFPFLQWTSGPEPVDYRLLVQIQHVTAPQRVYQERIAVQVRREVAILATAASRGASACASVAAPAERQGFSFVFRPWGAGPVPPPQRLDREALQVAKVVLDSLRAQGRTMELLGGIRLPYSAEPFYRYPYQTLLRANADSLEVDLDNLDFEVHLSERDGNNCNRWRLSASGSGVEEGPGYILGRLREIVIGGATLGLDDPDVQRLRHSQRHQDALYFRKYFRRTGPRSVRNGIVTRTGG